eukprot:m.333958 g.333958  ORF g.333958 m.333958 type:complete len:244 (-) comp17255_c0_seq1:2482-3213(-)
MSAKASTVALMTELKALQGREPLEGVSVELEDDNIYKWKVNIFGPPDTLYEGGYFKAKLEFPVAYPMEPPKMKFVTEMYHPNVYANGEICISILHPPGEDAMNPDERPEERWNPTQSVRTILLSVISLLNEPNIFSPANVDASVDYRNWKEKKSDKYEGKVKEQVANSKEIASKEGVVVPTSVHDYCIKATPDKEVSAGTSSVWSDSHDEDSHEEFDFEYDSGEDMSDQDDDGDSAMPDSGNE